MPLYLRNNYYFPWEKKKVNSYIGYKTLDITSSELLKRLEEPISEYPCAYFSESKACTNSIFKDFFTFVFQRVCSMPAAAFSACKFFPPYSASEEYGDSFGLLSYTG